jgi:hypothetical protein
MYREQPFVQGNSGVLEDRADSDREFLSAATAFIDAPAELVCTLGFGIERVCPFGRDAMWTHWTRRPAPGFHILCGVVLSQTIRGKIVHLPIVTHPWRVRKVNNLYHLVNRMNILRGFCRPARSLLLYFGLVSRLRPTGVQKASQNDWRSGYRHRAIFDSVSYCTTMRCRTHSSR